VLRDIDLHVKRGERIVICGPSGSGKSTLIRCINRLEEHQEGRLAVDGVELTDDVKAIEKVRREVGMVFQQFNLFPHLTVLDNLTLSPMWVGKMPKKDAEERAMQQLTRVKIAEQAKKYPLQLSGGQQPGGDRPRAVPHAEDHAVRRADLGARPGDDQGSARRDDRARQPGHHDAVRIARNGLRQGGRRPRDLHGPGPDRRAEHAGVLQPPEERARKDFSKILGH
jgi:hypothetical protein